MNMIFQPQQYYFLMSSMQVSTSVRLCIHELLLYQLSNCDLEMADLKAGHISLMILSIVMVSGSLFFYYLDFGRGPGFTMMERRPGSGSGPGSTVPGRGPVFTMMERRPGSGSGPGSTVPGRGPGFTMMERRPGSGSGPGSTVPGRGPVFTMMERRPGSGSGPGSTVPGRGPVFTMQKIRFTLLEQESRESLRGKPQTFNFEHYLVTMHYSANRSCKNQARNRHCTT